MNKLKELLKGIDLKKLRNTGFFSIFASTVMSKVLVFFGGIVVVKILSKTDYGIYAYVLNIISMLSLLNDFGASSATMQFILEEKDDVKKHGLYLKYAIKIGLVSSLVSSILIFISPLYYPYKIVDSQSKTLILTLIPVLTVIQGFIPIIMRINLDNKRYGIYQVGVTFINYAILISLSLMFGLMGAIVSNYIYHIIIIIWGLFLIGKYLKKMNFNGELPETEKKSFLKFSFSSQINNTISSLLIIVDTFLVGLLISNPEVVASYKVGSAIPHALSFLPSCVVIYILPYFIKNNKNKIWIEKNFKRLMRYGILLYGVFSIMLIVFSKIIFAVLYGSRYYDAIPIFIVLIMSFFFSSAIKIPCSNIIYTMRKVKFNIIVNIICIAINLISNYFFINAFGSIGAAITTLIISVVSSVIYLLYINKLLKNENNFEVK